MNGGFERSGTSDIAIHEALLTNSKRKQDSRRSKESRKSGGRTFSRHITANSDLLELGLPVGEQVDEEEEEAASARLSKRHQ